MARVLRKKRSEALRWEIQSVWGGRSELAGRLGLPQLVGQLLYNRGISEAEEARRFLQPSLSDLIEPQAMRGMGPAVKRIREAIQNQEKIVIYGDYDVDGIVGTAILWRCFSSTG